MKIEFPKYCTKNDFKITGIYFLLKKRKVVYIGMSVNAIARISSHAPHINFDESRIIECPKKCLKKYEKRWIIRFRPKYNTMHLFKFYGAWFTTRTKVPINLRKAA